MKRIVQAAVSAAVLLVLLVVFYLIVTPLALVLRLCGADPLDTRGPARESFWMPYPSRQRDPINYERTS